jgi:hypothetical protein
MKIDLRVAGADLGSISNVIFKPTKHFEMTLFPLPPEEWVGKQICSVCDGKPDFLQENMKPICRKCIKKLMVGLNKKESSIDTSIPITMEVVTHTRFEWSTDGEKWYSVAGRNIKVNRQDLFLRELKKSILENHSMSVEADYAKETKEMTITI